MLILGNMLLFVKILESDNQAEECCHFFKTTPLLRQRYAVTVTIIWHNPF